MDSDNYESQYESIKQSISEKLKGIEFPVEMKHQQLLQHEQLALIASQQTKERCFLSDCYRKFTNLNQCKYCGHLFCDIHGQENINSKRSCTSCFDQYQQYNFIKDFTIQKNYIQDNLNKYDEELEQNDKEIEQLEIECKQLSEAYGYDFKQLDQSKYEEQQQQIDKVIDHIKQNEQTIDQQQKQYHQDEIQQKEGYKVIEQKQQELLKKQGPQKEILERIFQQEQLIRNTAEIIDTIQQKITEYNYLLEKHKIGDDYRLSTQIQYQKQQEDMLNKIKLEEKYKREQQYKQDTAYKSSSNNEEEEEIEVDLEDQDVGDIQITETTTGKSKKNKKINKKHKKSKSRKKEMNEGHCGVKKCEIF